jgi:cytochrome P450
MSTTSPPAVETATPLPGPRGIENLRQVRHIFRDPSATLDELRASYGPVCGLGFRPARLAVVGDPALLHEMFAMRADSFRWGHKFNVIGVRFVVGKGSMIVSDGADHQRRRSSVQKAFSRPRLNGWIPMILDRTDSAIERIVRRAGDDDHIDLYPIGRHLVLGITVHAFFGERLAERVDEISRLFQRPQDFLEAAAVKQLPHPFPFTSRSRVRADRRAIDRIIDAEIGKRRSQPTRDALDVLDAIVHEGSLSDDEIRDQVTTLIGAGYDTTAATLAWVLWCAALEPDVWSRLRAEADLVLGPPHTPLDESDHTTLARLEYAQRVVRESLRLHPAGVIGAREAAVDLHLGDYLIPKGTLVLWSSHLAGRDPNAWADPLRFNPDRFAGLNPEQKAIADRAWVPFGRGPHMCIGFALAQMELTLIISRLAQTLDLTPQANHIPRPVGMVVNRPVGGAPFRVRPRGSTDLSAELTVGT